MRNPAGGEILQRLAARVRVLDPVEVMVVEKIRILVVGDSRRIHHMADYRLTAGTLAIGDRNGLFFELLPVLEELEGHLFDRSDVARVDPRLHGEIRVRVNLRYRGADDVRHQVS